jgi:hypothetical protein
MGGSAMSMNDSILDANKSFYNAFLDFDKMDSLWDHQSPLFCLHPGQQPLLDRVAIMESWRGIIDNEHLNIAPANEQVLDYGTYFMVVCEEVIDTGSVLKPSNEIMIASNLFVSIDYSRWNMVGHHSGRKT